MTDDSAETPRPKALRSEGGSLVIEWADEVTHRIPWHVVREMCPCATCRMKRAKPPEPEASLPVIDAAEAQPLKVTSMRPVGNYAYSIDFSDGHNTGIYSLEYLRALGEQMPPS